MKKSLWLFIPLCILVTVSALVITGPAYGSKLIISLDGTRTSDENETGGPRYLTSPSMVNATNILLGAGFTISTTDRFLAANIGGASVLYTGAVSTDFTNQELTDIGTFVSSGGGLVIQRDWGGFYPAADPLAAIFGVTYDSNSNGTAGMTTEVQKTADSPIWNGPAGSVTSYYQGYSSSIDSGATAIGVHASDLSETALAVLTYGLGRVVFLTDMDAWDDLGGTYKPLITPGSNNAIVWQNMFEYASRPIPEPATMLLFGTGLAALAGITRRKKKD